MERDEPPAPGGADGAEASGRFVGPGEDRDLIERIGEGDGDALRELMRRYDGLVRYTVFRVCRTECLRDPGFLDSRASEAWTGLVRSIQAPASRPPADLRTYLIQITRNKCADILRRPREPVTTDVPDEMIEHSLVDAAGKVGVDLLIEAEEVLALRACIDKLSYREKSICAQIEHISAGRWKAAAGALSMPESTLRSTWPGVVARLRACLEKKISKSLAPPPDSRDPSSESTV